MKKFRLLKGCYDRGYFIGVEPFGCEYEISVSANGSSHATKGANDGAERPHISKDKRATAHPSVVTKLNNVLNGLEVVIDGKSITSNGLFAITWFAILAIVSKLLGLARTRSLDEGLVS
ncbi:hypothetical protein D5086_018347 [Populus alba]|uniref:Uncharacterized protein n=1 Tax=Populus alba TaxID=43335 RepID=A0ACC4BPG6_POPAL